MTHIYKQEEDGSLVLVAQYVYDAWGNCKILLDVDGIATANPFRYRSYYLDVETDLYYLQTRYYDPETGRFISADSIEYLDPETLGGLNLYAYCGNNPVMAVDPEGTSLVGFLICFAVTALIGWVASKILGEQIAGGISSVANGGTAIATGVSLCAFGPIGIVAGIVLMAVGIATIALGVNEIVAGATGTNYIQEWTGWSDSVYEAVYMGFNIASAVGSIVGNIGMRISSNNILNSIIKDPAKIKKYNLWQIKTYGKYTSLYNQGTLKRGSHAGQGYTLTNKINPSRGYIQWHPGGGHHGVEAYWKITSSYLPTVRFYYLSGLQF